MALIDASSSTNKPEVHSVYQQALSTVLSASNGGDALVAYPVTSNSQASSYADVNVVFPTYNPLLQNEDQYQSARQTAEGQAEDGLEHLISFKDTAQGTDLLFAISQAEGTFHGDLYRQAKTKQLIVLTDGFEQSSELDMMKVDLTPSQIAQIITRLKAAGYLPDLSGVTVWMVGCGADPHHEISPEKLDQVRRFWLAYFKACHADLSSDRYGATLQNFAATT